MERNAARIDATLAQLDLNGVNQCYGDLSALRERQGDA